MREIKFRAKIKGDAGVYPVWDIDWLNQKTLIDRACGLEWVAFDRVEALMQFTGLKDKNGVEIYEGDIVRVGDGSVATCKWLDNSAGFHLIGRSVYAVGYTHYGENKQEVIGNIWEHPELLKD